LIINQVLINICFIIVCISLSTQASMSKTSVLNTSMRFCLLSSVLNGLLGIVLIMNRVTVTTDAFLDFRYIALVLSASNLGLIWTLLTGVIMAVYHLVHEGMNLTGVVETLAILVAAAGCGLLARTVKIKWKLWLAAVPWCIVVVLLTQLLIQRNDDVALSGSVIQAGGFIVVARLVYFYVNFMSELNVHYHSYREDSLKDHRTGLNNVRQFDERFKQIASRLAEFDGIITMLFIDIDFFKRINDRYGHQNGDIVLEELGKILISSCSHRDIVSRNGGEEFSVVMTDCPRDKIMTVAERIRTAVENYSFRLYERQIIHITVSIGVATYPDSVRDINKLLEAADAAMYEAKRSGRNKVVLAKPQQSALGKPQVNYDWSVENS
jgi:diguanylate cyclase